MQTKVKGMNGILMIAVLLIVFLFPLDVSAAETASAALVGYYEDGDIIMRRGSMKVITSSSSRKSQN